MVHQPLDRPAAVNPQSQATVPWLMDGWLAVVWWRGEHDATAHHHNEACTSLGESSSCCSFENHRERANGTEESDDVHEADETRVRRPPLLSIAVVSRKRRYAKSSTHTHTSNPIQCNRIYQHTHSRGSRPPGGRARTTASASASRSPLPRLVHQQQHQSIKSINQPTTPRPWRS